MRLLKLMEYPKPIPAHKSGTSSYQQLSGFMIKQAVSFPLYSM